MGKFWTSRNKGKKKSNLALKGKKSLGSPGRKLNQDTWGFLEAWDPRDMHMARLGLRQLKGACLETQRAKADMSH